MHNASTPEFASRPAGVGISFVQDPAHPLPKGELTDGMNVILKKAINEYSPARSAEIPTDLSSAKSTAWNRALSSISPACGCKSTSPFLTLTFLAPVDKRSNPPPNADATKGHPYSNASGRAPAG
jgi:hypothetical protein